MDLNPDDIVGYRFQQKLRGYAIEEVDDLLDRLADQVERMAAELDALRGQVQEAEARAAATRETEATLQRTLVVAQQAAERNLADASAQAEAMIAQAQAEAERLRREADEEASAVRAEADAAASRTLEQAQVLAQREVEAARARVEQAASRHNEVLVGVAFHRDALRGHLAALDELALEPAPAPRSDLVVGELPDDPDDTDREDTDPRPTSGSDDEAGAAGDPSQLQAAPREHDADAGPDPGAPLTVRVHEDRGDPAGYPPPLGSDLRDGD